MITAVKSSAGLSSRFGRRGANSLGHSTASVRPCGQHEERSAPLHLTVDIESRALARISQEPIAKQVAPAFGAHPPSFGTSLPHSLPSVEPSYTDAVGEFGMLEGGYNRGKTRIETLSLTSSRNEGNHFFTMPRTFSEFERVSSTWRRT